MHIGDIGVEIFFVISGFVIPFSAANSRPGQFLLKRFIRIYPAVLVSSFIAFGALCLASGNAASHIPALLRSLTLLPVGPWIDGVLWSLAVEIVFYCVIAFLIPLGARGRLMLAAWLGISSAVFTLAVAAVFYLDLHGLQQEAASSAIRYYWKISLVRHGVFFALGMLIHDLSHGNSDRSKRTCAIALTAVGAFQIVLFQHLSAPSIELAAASSVIKAGIWLLAIAALVVCIRRRAEIASLVGPWAGTVTSLGLLSYTLYLNHYTVGGVVGSALVAHGYNSVATLIITTSTILAISIWVQTGPERHLQDKLKQLLLARRVALART
ncbi:acyltransferase [Alsobacter metallidurans]|uniref:Acyltransferase n=2 Tax=Alsobacter metallidurans TaxID=340221 RepID=A0A917MKD0_9HYPH|nr:acyltransferase [Alsobacter metallidurans]